MGILYQADCCFRVFQGEQSAVRCGYGKCVGDVGQHIHLQLLGLVGFPVRVITHHLYRG